MNARIIACSLAMALVLGVTSTAAAAPPKPDKLKAFGAKLTADKGVVFGTKQVITDGSGFKVDLVAHKHGGGLDLKGGRKGTNYMPLHKFGNQTFAKLKDIPCVAPKDSEKNQFVATPKKGQGFTVRANLTGDVYRVRVNKSKGGMVKLKIQKCK